MGPMWGKPSHRVKGVSESLPSLSRFKGGTEGFSRGKGSMPGSLLCARHDQQATLGRGGVSALCTDRATEEKWGNGIPMRVLDRGSGLTHSKANGCISSMST